MIIADVWNAWEAALAEFCANHRELLTLGAHEQAITHQLGSTMAGVFCEWSVDCEYNRLGKEGKLLDSYRACLHDAGLVVPNLEPVAVRPDVIVHRRGHPGTNLLVVEVKKASDTRDRRYDLVKLQCLIDELWYSCGVFVEFGTDASEPVVEERRFERGHPHLPGRVS